MLNIISPEAQRSLGYVPGFVVDPEVPSMTPYQAGLVPAGGFPVQPDIVAENLGIIVPDITRELGYMDYMEGALADEVPPTQVIPLGTATVMGIPLVTWIIVMGSAAAGGSLGAYLMSKDKRAMIGGTVGGMLGGLLGVLAVSITGRRQAEAIVTHPVMRA